MARLFAILLCTLLAPVSARLSKFLKQYSPREKTCMSCYRSCPVGCYVGTCGLNFGFAVKRFEETSQCFSCDPVAGAESGDFVLCSGDEAMAADFYTPPVEFKPLTPSDRDADAMSVAAELKKSAGEAMAQAQGASAAATKLVAAANAKLNAAQQPNDADFKNAESLSARIKADSAERSLHLAQQAQQKIMGEYNVESDRLRKQELITENVEKKLDDADKSVEAARNKYSDAANTAASAARDAAIAGSTVASTSQIKAEAAQMIAAARSAVKASALATKNAKEAMRQASVASDIAKNQPLVKVLPPCSAAFLQTEADTPEQMECTEDVPAAQSVSSSIPDQQTAEEVDSTADAENAGNSTADETENNSEQESEEEGDMSYLTDDVSENMTKALALKLAEHPEAAKSAATFDISQAPGIEFVKSQMMPGQYQMPTAVKIQQ